MRPMTDERLTRLVNLPHATLQKFGTIEMVFVGVSRRFLAQITRHQNEVKFMASSFHTSDHSKTADFVVPYELMAKQEEEEGHNRLFEAFEKSCINAFSHYARMCTEIGHDAAAYLLPQATRCTLLVSATPYQWKHMIRTRICRKASTEIRYAMLNAWRLLYEADPILFSTDTTTPDCCSEASPCCSPVKGQYGPVDYLALDFPLLFRGDEEPVVDTFEHTDEEDNTNEG